MNSLSSPILIVGGGIGGLAVACFFGQKNIPVMVFEQRCFEDLETGAGLQLSPNATRILYNLGIDSQAQAYAHKPSHLHIQSTCSSWNNRRITSMDFNTCEQTHSFPYWTIRRCDLHHILYKHACSLPSITLLPKHTCKAFSIQNNSAQIRAETSHKEHTFHGHMIIGADGLHSQVRQWIYGSTNIHDSGMCAFRRVLSVSHMPNPWVTDTGLWLNPNGHIVHYPLGTKGMINIVIVQKNSMPLERSSPRLGTWIQKLPKALDWLSEFLSEDGLWKPHTLYTSTNKMPSWGSPDHRTFLLGDSAHPLLPFLAQGAALALEDAEALFQSFHLSSGGLSTLFAHYTRIRDKRTRSIMRRTLFTGHMYHLPSPLTPFRNLGLSLMGSRGLQTLQRSIYGFKNEICTE